MALPSLNRREFLALLSAAGVTGLGPSVSIAQAKMPMRPIPATGEMLPVVGLGSSKVVAQISQNGTEPLATVLRVLVAAGGSVVDTWPRDPENDAGLGRVLNEPDLRNALFVTHCSSHRRSIERAKKPVSSNSTRHGVFTAGKRSTWSRCST
jgi:hypothetical protein